MAKRPKRSEAEGKRRTRQHIIADMSVHYVEGLVLRCGFTLQRAQSDYGYDFTIDTFNEKNELETELLRGQVKASDQLARYAIERENVFSYPISTKDVRSWSQSLLPILFILYDAKLGEAYWLDGRDFARSIKPSLRGKTINVYVPRYNILGLQTIFLMREHAQKLATEYHETQDKKD